MYTPILATLGYVLSADRRRVLMMRRDKRPDDLHYGKYNGLGGKVRSDEDVVSAMRREILEESGLVADEVVLRGTISWTGFGRDGEDWFGFLFRIDAWHGDAHEGNGEGTLEWVALDDMAGLPMWPSDRHFLPMIFDDDPRTFHGLMPFAVGKALSWQYVRV
jgi:8-oxo-dGTP diphosphatase